jgi:hypothetical protein
LQDDRIIRVDFFGGTGLQDYRIIRVDFWGTGLKDYKIEFI